MQLARAYHVLNPTTIQRTASLVTAEIVHQQRILDLFQTLYSLLQPFF